MTDDLERRARLSAQRALLGEVPPALRAVVLSVAPDSIEMRWYLDGPLSIRDTESMSYAETQMMSDFAPEIAVSAKCIRVDAPDPIDDSGSWVFARREDDKE